MTGYLQIYRLWACLAAVFLPALAQADTIVATCVPGGCTCATSPLSTEELLFLVGDTLNPAAAVDPASDVLVHEPDLGVLAWVSAPLEDIQRQFGGSGACPVAQVADPEPILPLDGVWQWRTLAETTSGCPADLGAMLATSRIAYLQTSVVWRGAFDPADLSEGFPQPDTVGIPEYKWRKMGPERWLSDNAQSRDCLNGYCTQTAITLSATLIAPDRISGLLSLRSRAEDTQSAFAAGFGLADCSLRVRYDIVRIGP